MKKRMCMIGCLLSVLLPLLVTVAAAEQTSYGADRVEEYIEQFEQLLPSDTDIPADASELMQTVGVEGILALLVQSLTGMREPLLRFLCLLLGACCLMGLVPQGEGTPAAVVRAAIGAVFAVAVYEQLQTATSAVISSVGAASGFFSSLIPLLGTVTLASGAEATGAVQAFGMGVVAQGLQLCAAHILTPLSSFMFAIGLVGILGNEGGAQSLISRCKHLFLWVTGLLSTLLTAALGLQTVLASSTDGVAMRTLKYTISGSLPIVGGTVSGALSTLSTGLMYVKSTVGIGAVAVLLSLLLPPLAVLAMYRLTLGVAQFVWQLVCPDRSMPLLGAFSGALDTTLAAGAMSCVLMILTCVFFIKGGAGVVF